MATSLILSRTALAARARTFLPRHLQAPDATVTWTIDSSNITVLALCRMFRTNPNELAALNPSIATFPKNAAYPTIKTSIGTTITVPRRGIGAPRFGMKFAKPKGSQLRDQDCGAGFLAMNFTNDGSVAPNALSANYSGCLSQNRGKGCALGNKPGLINDWGACVQPCRPGTRLNTTTGRCEAIPGEVPTTAYQITRGDTVRGIANRLGVDVAAVIALNPKLGVVRRPGGLDLARLGVGNFLRVPAASMRSGVTPRGALGDLTPTEDADGNKSCPPGFTLDVGYIYDSCVFNQKDQPCGNGGTYDSDGNCTGESTSGGDSGGSGTGINDQAALDNFLSSTAGAAGAYSAYTSGADAGSYAASLGAGSYILCTLKNAFLVAIFPMFAYWLAKACSEATASGSGDGSGGNPVYPQECDPKGQGMFRNAADAPCVFQAANQPCKVGGVVGIYDTNGSCIDGSKAGTVCTSPNGWEGRYDSSGACQVQNCPAAQGVKFADDGLDCIKVTAPGGSVVKPTPPAPKPGGGGGGVKPTPGGGGGTTPPVLKPTTAKKDDDNTVLYVAAGGAAALAIGVAWWQAKKKKRGGR